MNWMPIGAAPLDGTYCDLWVKGPDGEQRRVADCSYVAGEWGNSRGAILWTITHYAKITPPQVPLTWPDKAGWYWVSNPATKTVKPFYIQFPAPTDRTTGKEFIMDGLLYFDDIGYGFKFLPAPIPSFEGG